MLRYLNKMDGGDCARIVRTIASFDFHGHFCIVMRRLGASLLHWREQQHATLSRSLESQAVPTRMIDPLRTLALRKCAAKLESSCAFFRGKEPACVAAIAICTIARFDGAAGPGAEALLKASQTAV